MTYYIKRNGNYSVTTETEFDICNRLPAGFYTCKFNPIEGYYLKISKPFDIPEKLYGSVKSRTQRIIKTFLSRPSSTGVLLNGTKGSGKSLLAKNIATCLVEAGIPAILVSGEYSGDGFNSFIRNIDQEAMFLFDEFEKVYQSQSQAEILSLLDGVYNSKKLFVLTSNDNGRIDSNMKNRPGRIFYAIEYKGLENIEIEEFCKDRLNNKKYIKDMVELSKMFDAFNFDMLQAIVEEMNRYDESPREALELMNIQSVAVNRTYTLTITDAKTDEIVNKKEWTGYLFSNKPLHIDFLDKRYVDQSLLEADDKDNEELDKFWKTISLGYDDCMKLDSMQNKYVYAKGGYQFTFERMSTGYDSWAYAF